MNSTPLKLISWNVNGLRAVMKKNFLTVLNDADADIFAIQETKLQEPQLTPAMCAVAGYTSYFSHASTKKGYSGVGVYTRRAPTAVKTGIGIPRFDDEGRILELIFDDFSFFNVYFPNGQMSDERLHYKLDFYDAFFDYTDRLMADGRSVVIAGDYNTAHNEIDLKHPGPNSKRSGFLPIERQWLDRIVARGYVDTFRTLYPDTVKYSWWSYRFNARKTNAGWRIDYFFTSKDLFDDNRVVDAWIDNDIFGSDHCPVGLALTV
ncbi:MAG: exodeoxyribonuclease III [Desulfosarcinaceae bacterium]|nr:exodeoxyribonuclease III [Desulfosarcinaceae bacterium]